MENAANALALLESAVQDHFPLSPEAIQLGLQHVRWKGRLELIQRDPIIILDGAHNPLGARVLFDFLQSQIHDCPGRRLIMVVGMMVTTHNGWPYSYSDKDGTCSVCR
jgi:dihydrofolate synthase/folylpolyglutamate synthase